VANEQPDPMDSFETWLLRRVAHAVEAGEVPAELLTELHSELTAARARPQEEGHAAGGDHYRARSKKWLTL
jgi:hypothetical protein